LLLLFCYNYRFSSKVTQNVSEEGRSPLPSYCCVMPTKTKTWRQAPLRHLLPELQQQ
jgi:hypothetical protein